VMRLPFLPSSHFLLKPPRCLPRPLFQGSGGPAHWQPCKGRAQVHAKPMRPTVSSPANLSPLFE
jgi:hypothetical protein